MKLVCIAAIVWLAGCGAQQQPAQKAAEAPPAAPFTLASVFPDGPGRDKVMNACGSCHSVVCVTRGQRNAEKWNSIRTGHRDKLVDSSAADVDMMFHYLAVNFNETKPEPAVPAELAQQGCTPF